MRNAYYFKYFFGTLSFFVILLIIASSYIYKSRYDLNIIEKNAIEKTQIQHLDKTIRMEFEEIVMDLCFLSNSKCIQDYFKLNRKEDHQRIEETFKLYSQTQKKYDQIRLLDIEGQEKVRVNLVNKQAVVIPKEKLQNKKHRYYFKESRDLDQGQIYVSKFDLNVENNKVEIPYKPVIRFGISVFVDGEKKGVVVLNYLGNNVLNRLQNISTDSKTKVILLNTDGYYLKSDIQNCEWAFMFDNPENCNFKSIHPEIWNEMMRVNEGNFLKDDLLINFKKISLQSFNSSLQKAALGYSEKIEESFLVLGTLMPKKEINKLKKEILKPILFLSTIILLICLLISHIIATTQFKKYISEKRLINEKEIAVAANSAKDRFVSIVAHDLKTPFFAVLGFTDLLKDNYEGYTDDERKKYIYNINLAAKNIYQLFENLLAWGRTKTGRIAANPKNFYLKENIIKTVNLVNISAKQKEIQVINQIQDNLQVYADPMMINTIIRNLLSNAIKFTKSFGKILLASEIINGEIVISIEDNGIGIPDDVKKHLFKLDKSIYSKGTNNEIGTGLGLLVCKDYVEMNQGKLWFESTVGKGSKFYFTIPKARV